MLRALWTGATGMNAQQFMIDTIANNLANVNTAGYKRQRVNFKDLYYQELWMGRNDVISVGHGSRVSDSMRSFAPGNLEKTDDPLSLAIEGLGFFCAELPDGTAYTRDGNFRVDGEGMLVTSDGYPVVSEGGYGGEITIPQDATEVTVSADGTVLARVGDELRNVGQIRLAMFPNPAGLQAVGRNLFKATVASGEPRTVIPGEEGSGRILSGFLETSNVQIVTEMVNLIVAQRAFELNSKAVETADQMLGVANNLKR